MTKGHNISDQRIAFYGGAFDPIHKAHLAVAEHAIQQICLDQVVFIPTAQSPLKKAKPSCSDQDRVEMLRLALAGRPQFQIDRSEIEAGGVSYTLHTVEKMRTCYPEAEFFWIIGGDQFELLEHWFAIETLSDLITFLVLLRPGSTVSEESAIPGLRYQVVEAPLMDVSSSEIRRRVRDGEAIVDLVPESVAHFIDRRGLYKT